MYFYVDESGHTGAHLFDENQPFLYYGVLSSLLNIDILGIKYIPRLRRALGVERLHAAELGNGGLVSILPELRKIQLKFKVNFDIYRVAKPDHALICFFDQVFDQGMNPAVPWTSYWTPLRYVLLLKVSMLFDEDILKEAWATRIERNSAKAEKSLVNICAELRSRVSILSDARSQQIITDALQWTEKNPNKINYNIGSKAELLSITPNLIGFQSVMHGIALRILKHKVKRPNVVVDQQSQFNKTQRSLAEFYAKAKETGHLFEMGPGMPSTDYKGIPSTPIEFKSSHESFGLELVDIYLWIFKRFMEKKTLATELHDVIRSNMHKTVIDEISINAIANRWSKWFENLPEVSKEQEEQVKEMLAFDEERRLRSMISEV
ncbi:DUF3800 domain-containing protein [Thermodesulfobacteriota bacterium]